MKMSQLLTAPPSALAETEITKITNNSRQVAPGTLFFCIRGSKSDGHTYASSAYAAGAAAIVCERDCGVPNQILVEDTRAAYALCCAAWFDHPAEKLKLVGVTGTNGKTSVTRLICSMLRASGHHVGLMGTIENLVDEQPLPAKNTTPDAYELHEMLDCMAKAGCDYAVMEVSSHALDQKRVYGLHFAAALFTNLTQDHLDYHGDMESYKQCKKKLFQMCDTAIINLDDPAGPELLAGLSCKTVTYALDNEQACYIAKNVECTASGVHFELVGYSVIGRVRFGTPGRFSVYNALAAGVCALELGIPLAAVTEALNQIDGVKGRAEVVPTGRDFTVIIDYAHTPDGLQNICSTLRAIKTGRLITLFGCGGDRDKTKRPLMGKIAAEQSDFIIVTSDNPRTELPGNIIDDILVGLEGDNTPRTVIENRREAIFYAIDNAKPDDIILLAGKGHETYQVLGTETVSFDEREIVAEALKSLN